MNKGLKYLQNRYSLNLDEKSPIRIIPNDRQRWGRWYALPEIFKELGYKIGAEIGVEKGRYSVRLCEKIPGLKLFSIDAWAGYKGYREHVSQEKLDGFYKTAQERLSPYDCDIIRGYSMNVVKDFEDESLDFVYIDSGHNFVNVANDIFEWEKKVRVGGVVSGHDYRRHKPHRTYQCHVVQVVNAYTSAFRISPWFIIHGDKSPSWFWVKT